jgi:hypothetical protein
MCLSIREARIMFVALLCASFPGCAQPSPLSCSSDLARAAISPVWSWGAAANEIPERLAWLRVQSEARVYLIAQHEDGTVDAIARAPMNGGALEPFEVELISDTEGPPAVPYPPTMAVIDSNGDGDEELLLLSGWTSAPDPAGGGSVNLWFIETPHGPATRLVSAPSTLPTVRCFGSIGFVRGNSAADAVVWSSCIGSMLVIDRPWIVEHTASPCEANDCFATAGWTRPPRAPGALAAVAVSALSMELFFSELTEDLDAGVHQLVRARCSTETAASSWSCDAPVVLSDERAWPRAYEEVSVMVDAEAPLYVRLERTVSLGERVDAVDVISGSTHARIDLPRDWPSIVGSSARRSSDGLTIQIAGGAIDGCPPAVYVVQSGDDESQSVEWHPLDISGLSDGDELLAMREPVHSRTATDSFCLFAQSSRNLYCYLWP